MAVRAVLFDLYDTLALTTRTGAWGKAARALTEAGVDPEVWQSCWRRLLPDCLRGEITLIERVRRALALAGGDPDDWVLADQVAGLMHARSALRTYPDVRAGLTELRQRGYRLALVSNIASYRTGWLHDVELAPHFDALALSCELGVLKPDPEIYRWTAARLEVKPKECVFVADGAFQELSAARQLGMTAVRVDRDRRDDQGPRDEGFDHRVGNLRELLDWLPAGARSRRGEE